MAWNTPYVADDCMNVAADYNQFVTYLNGWTTFFNAVHTGTISNLSSISAGDCWNTLSNWTALQDRISLFVSKAIKYSLVANGQEIAAPASDATNIHMMYPDDGDTDTFERFVTDANAELSAASITGCDFSNTGYTSETDIPWTRSPSGTGPMQQGDCLTKIQINQLWAACKVLEDLTFYDTALHTAAGNPAGRDITFTINDRGAKSHTSPQVSAVCATELASFNSGWPGTWGGVATSVPVEGYAEHETLAGGNHSWNGRRRKGDHSYGGIPTGTNVNVKIAHRYVAPSFGTFRALDVAATEGELTGVTEWLNNASATRATGTLGDASASPANGANSTVTCSDTEGEQFGFRVTSLLAIQKTQGEPT